MILYLDTSLIVASLTREDGSGRIQAWLEAQQPGALAISPWVQTEFAAALSIKMRTGRIGAAELGSAARAFVGMVGENLVMLPIGDAAFHVAASFGGRPELSLRAGDALHLAVCAEHGASLCTLDQGMARAARELGLAVEPV